MTLPTPGESRRKPSSSATDAAAPIDWVRAVLLFFSGGAVVALHAVTRGAHLHLPGHQGLVWLALLAFARAATGRGWAASLAGVGAAAAATLPFLGFNDPLSIAGYLVPAVVFDVLSNRVPASQHVNLRAGVLGAAALATKALLQAVATVTLGWSTAVANRGFAYTLMLHLAFGFTGAILGAWLWQRAADTRRTR